MTDRLDGWKEIASYLRRAERTAKIYERRLGLPVHRLRGQQKGGVFAYRSEVDAWMRGSRRK